MVIAWRCKALHCVDQLSQALQLALARKEKEEEGHVHLASLYYRPLDKNSIRHTRRSPLFSLPLRVFPRVGFSTPGEELKSRNKLLFRGYEGWTTTFQSRSLVERISWLKEPGSWPMGRIVTQKVSTQNLHGDRRIFSSGFGIPDSIQKLALSSNKSLQISSANTEPKLRTLDSISSNHAH